MSSRDPVVLPSFSRHGGRPNEFWARRALKWVSGGGHLGEFAKQEGNPPWAVIAKWLQKDPDFRERYRGAREVGLTLLSEELVKIADEPDVQTRTITFADGTTQTVEEDNHNHRKLRIETRKWLLTKLSEEYGERVRVDTTITVRELDETTRAARIRALLNAARARQKPHIKLLPAQVRLEGADTSPLVAPVKNEPVLQHRPEDLEMLE